VNAKRFPLAREVPEGLARKVEEYFTVRTGVKKEEKA